MTDNRFSEPIRIILQQAGWYPGRSVHIDEGRAHLEGFGFEVHNTAMAFLSEFSGIHLDLYNGPFDFKVDCALQFMVTEDIPYLNKLIGKPLCPVAYGGRRFMLIAPDGEYVLLSDEWIYFVTFSSIGEAFQDSFFPIEKERELRCISASQLPPDYQENDPK